MHEWTTATCKELQLSPLPLVALLLAHLDIRICLLDLTGRAGETEMKEMEEESPALVGFML